MPVAGSRGPFLVNETLDGSTPHVCVTIIPKHDKHSGDVDDQRHYRRRRKSARQDKSDDIDGESGASIFYESVI